MAGGGGCGGGAGGSSQIKMIVFLRINLKEKFRPFLLFFSHTKTMVIGFFLRDKGEKGPSSPLYPTVSPRGTLLGTDFCKHPGCWVWVSLCKLYLDTYLVDICEYLETSLKIKL